MPMSDDCDLADPNTCTRLNLDAHTLMCAAILPKQSTRKAVAPG